MRAFAVLLFLTSPAFAGHMWYSASCCDDTDCRPVGRGVVAFGFQDGVSGYFINDRLPVIEFFPEFENGEPNIRILPSQDRMNHICRPLRQGILGQRINTRCVYVAPSGN